MQAKWDRRSLKLGSLAAARSLGLFALARLLTARSLRILCYHGIGAPEDVAFAPALFMTLAAIRGRFSILERGPYNVMPLASAVEALRSKRPPRLPVVITFDDGLTGNLTASQALLAEFNFPVTLYVTTYYVVKQTPVFRLAVRYMIWMSKRSEVSTEGLSPSQSYHGGVVDLRDAGGAAKEIWALVLDAEKNLSELQRVELARELGRRLGVDYDTIARERHLSLLSVAELKELSDVGIDIQLHTHRHCMPEDATAIRQEINDNRVVIENATGRRAVHLCYPSGVYSVDQWQVLEGLGVESATTCEPGLNDATTPALALHRFVDAERISELEFEAELSGITEIWRRLRRLIRRAPRTARGVEATAYGH